MPASADYVDENTGEVFLELGKLPTSSPLHPDHVGKVSRGLTLPVDDDDDDDDDVSHYGFSDDSHDKLKAAVDAYAENWSQYDTELGEPDQLAYDAADGFFHQYPDWKLWARDLDMSKSDVLSFVADAVHDKMLTYFNSKNGE